jgi:hypothetical protein
MKKLISAIALAAAAYFSPAAQAQEVVPVAEPASWNRVAIGNPVADADANSSAYSSAVTALGKGLEGIADDSGLGDSVGGRAGLALADAALVSLAGVVSHELGHLRATRDLGIDARLSLFPFRYGLFSSGELEIEPLSCGPFCTTDHPPGVRNRYARAGPNQDQLNGVELWRGSREFSNWYRDIGLLQGGLDSVWWLVQGRKHADTGIYELTLDALGSSFSRSRMAWHRLGIGALNLSTVESGVNLVDYVLNGARAHEPLALAIGPFSLHPPRLAHYLTDKGEFAVLHLQARGPVGLELVLGRDLDEFQRRAGVDRARAGLAIGIPVAGVYLEPFAHVTASSENLPSVKGVAAGLRVSIPIIDGLRVEPTMLYARNDILENGIKEHRDGLRFAVAVEYRW